MEKRIETDTMGGIEVPSDKMWGAQTQRSLENFQIGKGRMPIEVVYALAIVKNASAVVNTDLGLLTKEKRDLIVSASLEVLEGKYDDHFPLVVWQTGSGTQTNMNMNEVLSNLANVKAGSKPGVKAPIHPNDDVNKSQSSNDVFPTASCIAAAIAIKEKLLPDLAIFYRALCLKAEEYKEIVKCGRTHLMDATPLTLGQEFSGYATQIKDALAGIELVLPRVCQLALGGTAVGTGLNSPPKYAEKVAKQIAKFTGIAFCTAPNKFEALSSIDGLVALSAAVRGLAISMYKIASDIRLLGSGPRCGFMELDLPENEPGSSIMPGKVNPTQCESMTQVCTQVIGNDAAIAFAGSQGHLQLNVYRPVVIHNLIESINLLGDVAKNFTLKCLNDLKPNRINIETHLQNSLMLVTALNTHIGYDNAAKIAKTAHREGKTLKEVAVELKLLTAEEFDKYVNPLDMTHPG